MWYDPCEHLPEPNKLLLVYVEEEKIYGIASWNPCSGWVTQLGMRIYNVDYWFDGDLPLMADIEESEKNVEGHGS